MIDGAHVARPIVKRRTPAHLTPCPAGSRPFSFPNLVPLPHPPVASSPGSRTQSRHPVRCFPQEIPRRFLETRTIGRETLWKTSVNRQNAQFLLHLQLHPAP